jgi:hypothetical protein
LTDLRPVLLTGRRETKREQMPECVNSQMDLAAFAPLCPVVASAGAALRRRLQSAAIKDSCRRLLGSALSYAQDGAQVMSKAFEDASFQLLLCLLIDD